MAKHRSLEEFKSLFPDETSCADFLAKRRWPEGWFCPACGCMRPSKLSSRAFTYECLDCRHQTSITAGTIMHRSKLPLTTWFWAAHLMSSHSNGMSALQLKAQLGITYKTAWLLTQKVRRSMVDPDRTKLSGLVEVDQTEMPFRTKAAFFNDSDEPQKLLIIGAVEVIDKETGNTPRIKRKGSMYHNTRAGRVRLAIIPNNSAAAIQGFVRANVEPKATLITDGHKSYLGLTDYRHDRRVVTNIAGHIPLPWIHRVFSLLKRWSLGTYHGLRRKHVSTYLEEFVFRFNRRAHRKVSLDTLFKIVTSSEPQSYWDIIGRENSRKGEPTKRRSPRRRKTTLGYQKDGKPATKTRFTPSAK